MVKRTTANEPAGEVDPGGTHPTKPGKGRKDDLPKTEENTEPEQHVESGDRNSMPPMPSKP